LQSHANTVEARPLAPRPALAGCVSGRVGRAGRGRAGRVGGCVLGGGGVGRCCLRGGWYAPSTPEVALHRLLLVKAVVRHHGAAQGAARLPALLVVQLPADVAVAGVGNAEEGGIGGRRACAGGGGRGGVKAWQGSSWGTCALHDWSLAWGPGGPGQGVLAVCGRAVTCAAAGAQAWAGSCQRPTAHAGCSQLGGRGSEGGEGGEGGATGARGGGEAGNMPAGSWQMYEYWDSQPVAIQPNLLAPALLP
jgi:hypothetical protein